MIEVCHKSPWPPNRPKLVGKFSFAWELTLTILYRMETLMLYPMAYSAATLNHWYPTCRFLYEKINFYNLLPHLRPSETTAMFLSFLSVFRTQPIEIELEWIQWKYFLFLQRLFLVARAHSIFDELLFFTKSRVSGLVLPRTAPFFVVS